MERKLANCLLTRTMWSMYDTVECTVQFCLQKPNVLNSKYVVEEYLRGFVDSGGLYTTTPIQLRIMLQMSSFCL